jgi:hypothetical protein
MFKMKVPPVPLDSMTDIMVHSLKEENLISLMMKYPPFEFS